MKRSIFLLTTALASFAFGAVMFFAPQFAAKFLAIETAPQTIAVLRGLGGLIIGSGAINYFLRNQTRANVITGLLSANLATHSFGLAADVWGIFDGALSIFKFAPVELTHLFVGIGSLVYLLRLKTDPGNLN